MTKKPLTWCGVEVTEEEYERLSQEYLRAFVDAEFEALTEAADVVLVVSEPARVGRIKP